MTTPHNPDEFGRPGDGSAPDAPPPAETPPQPEAPAQPDAWQPPQNSGQPPYPAPQGQTGPAPQGQPYPAPQGQPGAAPQGQPAGTGAPGQYPQPPYLAGQYTGGQTPWPAQAYPGQPVPGQPVPGPAPARKPRFGLWIRLGIAGVLVIVGVVAALLSFNVRAAKVGDCLAQSGSDSVKPVQCDAADVDFVVVGVVPNTGQPVRGLANPCEQFSEATSYYWQGRTGSKGTLLCLRDA